MESLSSYDVSKYIPQELWFNIFNYLPHTPEALCNLSLVCQIFHAISQDWHLWEAATKNCYPNTHAHLSERQMVQHSADGIKRRKLGEPVEIDWRQECIDRARFFASAKKNQLRCTPLLQKQLVTCFDVLDERIFAGSDTKLVSFVSNEEPISTETKQKEIISSIKAEKREDGETYVYTGEMNGNITCWKFLKEGCFVRREEFFGHRTKVFEIVPYGKYYLFSADYDDVYVWDKETGDILLHFPHSVKNDGYTSLTVAQGKIYASTILGIIRIWDAKTFTFIGEIGKTQTFAKTIKHLRVWNDKIFYTSNKGIQILDLENLVTKTIKTKLQSFAFEIFDDKLFYVSPIEGTSSHGIRIINIETLTIQSGPFSAIETEVFAIKVGPRGILDCSSKSLRITQI